jgi:YYY domain-containing protein
MPEKRPWIYDLLLIAVLVLAAWLRVTGVEWGEGQHQHPDELFLSGVTENLRAHVCLDQGVPIDGCSPERQRWMTPAEYFDTANSTLNPNNRGAGFYVYGNLPLTLVRTIYELIGPSAGPLKYFGRQFSAIADLLTILILYFIVARLYERRIALLAAAFSALTVMQIQQSHFYTVDLFMNPFIYAALYFAVRIAYDKHAPDDIPLEASTQAPHFLRDPLFLNSILFGLFLGMAAACKINAVVMAVMLPIALLIRHVRAPSPAGAEMNQTPSLEERAVNSQFWLRITIALLAGGIATLVAFRVFQPYAFDGLVPSQKWLESMSEIRAQATGLADLPWNLQWARRTHLYSFTNLTVWGLGLPLGILAWAGFLVMGWRILKGGREHLLLWVWTAIYFVWQSLQFNATMRYQLPIYPLLCMMAAWLVFQVTRFRIANLLLRAAGGIVLVLTAVWAFAFLSIYTHPETRIAASHWIYQNVPGPINLHYEDGTSQPLPFTTGMNILSGAPYVSVFTAETTSSLSEILLPHVLANPAAAQTLTISLLSQPDAPAALGTASVSSDFDRQGDPRGRSFTMTFAEPIPLIKGQTYSIRIETTGGVVLSGAGIVNETDYDWSLPFRVDGYDAFGGLYRGDLNLQVYWDDNADKLNRFQDILNQADYIFIPTNHQYAQITRIPERYPLTTLYYRELIGCPRGEDIIKCYRMAEPGMYEGRLGFDLVKTFTSYPTLGPLVINDGAAEEAFTFYDHPKVLIFKKNAGYESAKVSAILGTVDLSKVVHLAPKDAASYKPPKTLMLPADRLAGQRAGGTWSQLFDYDWLQNRVPALSVIFWYAFIFLLGLFTYPLARRALPGLADKGYALSRTLGLVILAYVPWLMGSLGVGNSRTSIAIVLGFLALIGAWQAWVQRKELASDWKSNRRMYLILEGVFLALFLIDLAIRLGNPDLWHPAKGGERPMDFSYFNAVIKSTTFPPYDPWFAGGYINYYYYGFVLVGTPVKLLGIVPTIAYNLILPTLFALVGISAFSIGSNLVRRDNTSSFDTHALVTGIASTALMLLLGNLGTIQMLIRTFQRLGAPGGVVGDANFLQRFVWGLDGLAKSLAGNAQLPGVGDWYWLPSRVIPAPGDVEPITEFPLFTFLYSDMHAHMIVMILTLFVIAWGLSFIRSARDMQDSSRTWSAVTRHAALPILLGALVLGAIYPTNTWDAYTFIPLAAVAAGYGLFNAVNFNVKRFNLSPNLLRFAFAILGGLALVVLTFLYYQPYFQWWGSGYNNVDAWRGGHTPLASYFTHWGVFLFLLFAWMAWETREWMASTPLASLGKLKPYQLLIELFLAVFFVLLVYLLYRKAAISLVALPMAFWAAILILRPGQPDAKRWVLFMVGTALVLTIAVEIIVVVGDVGRMNTVFKLYLQAWAMLSVSAAGALGWTLPVVSSWRIRWRTIWQTGLILLLSGAAMFTISATLDKMRDRMNLEAPHTLDSMTYMATAQYWDSVTMDLGQDYRAIRWMQDHVQGSPVIVEGNCVEYRWCTRFTIYTGLPGVVGWNWHQRQQRGFVEPMIVENRIAEIMNFYTMPEIASALAFLQKYDVHYIIVGQVESVYYPGEGLLKFEQYDGTYWSEVFRDGQTVIYEVK